MTHARLQNTTSIGVFAEFQMRRQRTSMHLMLLKMLR